MKRIKDKNKFIFLLSALVIPGVQFVVFYILVNINSVALSFKEYNGITFDFVWFKNYKELFINIIKDEQYLIIFRNTFKMYFVSEILMTIFAMLIAYALWKNVKGYRFFSLMLFLPSIVSSVVFVMVARFLNMDVFPTLFSNYEDLFDAYTTGFDSLMIYGCFLGIGTKIILISGAMSGVDVSIVEYSQLDGMNSVRQFLHVIFPHIYPTLISLFMLGCANIFSNMGLLLTFYSVDGTTNVKTIGYYIYLEIYNGSGYYSYAPVATLGVVLTILVMIYSFLMKKLLTKIGPSEA